MKFDHLMHALCMILGGVGAVTGYFAVLSVVSLFSN